MTPPHETARSAHASAGTPGVLAVDVGGTKLAACRDGGDVHRVPTGADPWGALTLSVGLAALLVGLSEGERWGWLSAATHGTR